MNDDHVLLYFLADIYVQLVPHDRLSHASKELQAGRLRHQNKQPLKITLLVPRAVASPVAVAEDVYDMQAAIPWNLH